MAFSRMCGLRVGLTGGLGSGKSTVAALLAARGAHILSADDLGRQLMEPGTSVFEAIVQRFGLEVVQPDGRLDRATLARISFAENRVEELNAIVHPATIALQGEMTAALFAREPSAIVVVESALIFETKYGEGWRERFDCLVLVTAPEEQKIARFIARSSSGDPAALSVEARRRLARMIPDEVKARECGFVLRNAGTLTDLRSEVAALWRSLEHANV